MAPLSPPGSPAAKARAPHEWLYDLQKAKAEGLKSPHHKVTIPELVERANDPKALERCTLQPTSPRSVDACLRLGIDPCELRFQPVGAFHIKGEEEDLAQIAFDFHETVRQERLQALVEERKRIIEEMEQGGAGKPGAGGAAGGGGTGDVGAGTMVAKEAKRLEVMQRRQAREMEQLMQFELLRKAMQEKAEAKMKALDARSEAQRAARHKAEAEWRAGQHARELALAAEEVAREASVKAVEQARFARELELAKKEAAEEKERRRQAYLREQERLTKAEEARRETERILAQQQAELQAKKEDMLRRDAEREKVKAAQAEEAATRNAEARAKAEARISAALAQNAALLAQRREAFEAKQAHNEDRRKAQEAAREREAAEKAEHAETERALRQQAYAEAQRREAQRVATITAKQAEKEHKLRSLERVRRHESAARGLHRQLDLDLKREKVAAMKRRDLYGRSQLLERIEAETARARDLVAQRSALQEQRKMANMNASFERQKLYQAVEKVQASKKWDKLGGGGATAIASH